MMLRVLMMGCYGVVIGVISFIMPMAKAQSVSIPELPGVNQQDERREVVNPTIAPWSLIGRVQTDLGQKCTGFLINPRVVVTAAHCLWIKKTRRFFSPQSIHFVFQYQWGQYKSAYNIQKIIVSDSYQGSMSGKESLNNVTLDKAYLVLDKAIQLPYLVTQAKEIPMVGTPLLMAGYDQDRIEVLYADTHCSVQNIVKAENGLIIIQHDCQGTYGSSGAPLFIQKNGHFEIIGNQVAAYDKRSGGLASFIANPLQAPEKAQ